MRRLRHLHRWVGVLAALFTLWLAVSGILLQHAPELGLHERFVTRPFVLAWYGVRVDEAVQGFAAGHHDVVQLDERIFVGRHRLAVEDASLRGAIADGDDIVIALVDGVLRVDRHGRILDRVADVDGVPTPIERIGRAAGGQIAIASTSRVWALSADFLEVLPLPEAALPQGASAQAAAVRWSARAQQPAPDDETAAAYLDGVISWERLLADLHSGRLAGGMGPWLVDASAVALILLALSGLWLFVRTR